MASTYLHKLMYVVIFYCMLTTTASAQQGRLTAIELSREIMSFHDNYQEAISETIDEIIQSGVDANTRLLYHTTKVFYTQSSIDIASDSVATEQLIDMLIMLRLQRLVWEAGGNLLSTPQQVEAMVAVLIDLEQQLHTIAARVFQDSDIDLIMSLAGDWKRDNPDREYMAFVRFTSLGDSVAKAALNQKISSGGLFSLSDTNQEIEEARYSLEKALFVAHHMPILLEWQAELFMYKALATSEIEDLLGQSDRTVLAMERMSANIEELPDDVSAILERHNDEFVEMGKTIEATSENLRVISAQISPLFLEGDNNLDGEVDLVQIKGILQDAHAATLEIVRAIEAFENLEYDEDTGNHLGLLLAKSIDRADELFAKHLDDLDQRLAVHRTRIFYLMVLLCVLFPVIFFGCYVMAKRHLNQHSVSLNINT